MNSASLSVISPSPSRNRGTLTWVHSSTSPDGTSAALPEVSWQTCFWILITLALNTMAQPCGKVCNRNSRYSTYMRSGPFHCLADTLSILSKIAYFRLKVGSSLCKSVRIVIDERFGTHEEVRVFARSSWLRWLFFILGPMPQAIRLASFRGTFWTQFFGFSYLLSWLLIEILGLISARTVIRDAATTDHFSFKFLDRLYETLAGLCYCYIYSYFVTSLTDFVRGKSRWGKLQEWDSLDWTFIVLLNIFNVLSLWIRDNLIVRALSIFCRKNIVMGQNLLVAFPEGEPETLKVDDDAVCWLVFPVANLLLCLAGYRSFYDSSGTVNPGWTAVFG